MMPLWTRAMRPAASVWGWALRRVGAPWVAQRVWAMPMLAAGRASPLARSISASRTLMRPTARRTCSLRSASMTARPAES